MRWGSIIIFILINIGVVGGFAFFYPFSFNYETEINDQYYLTIVWPLVVLTIGLYAASNRCRFSAIQMSFLLLVLTTSALVVFSQYYHWGNEHFYVVVTVMLVTGLVLFVKETGLLYCLLLLLSGLFLYQLYTGYTQYFEAAYYADSVILAPKGTFQNSGVMAMYLVAQLPLFYFFCVELRFRLDGWVYWKWLRLVCFVIVLIATTFLVYQTQSRTAWIALAVTIVGWLFFQKGTAIKRKIKAIPKAALLFMTIPTLVVISFAGYYLFVLKKASALGRMMKLDITAQHITDHFFTGTGLGRFSWYYPQWQAEYFRHHPNPPQSFFLSAGESYIIFNEPLQLFKEIGLIGFVLFVIGLVCFFSTCSATYPKLLAALKLTVITILACSVTSYPLHVNFILWLFSFCFFTAFVIGDSSIFSFTLKYLSFLFNKRIQLFLTAVVFIFASVAAIKGISQFKAYQQWMALQSSFEEEAEKIPQYELLKRALGNDGKFLTTYGESLLSAGKPEIAATVLEESQNCFITRQTIELLAEAYNGSGKPDKAIITQEWLCNFLPNKFATKQKLLKLYLSAHDTANAKRIAQIILTMPVKIPSKEVEQIKADAIKILLSE